MERKYNHLLILHLVSQIEYLLLHSESLQWQIDKIDEVFVGTRFNWKGTGRGRIEVLEQLMKEAK